MYIWAKQKQWKKKPGTTNLFIMRKIVETVHESWSPAVSTLSMSGNLGCRCHLRTINLQWDLDLHKSGLETLKSFNSKVNFRIPDLTICSSKIEDSYSRATNDLVAIDGWLQIRQDLMKWRGAFLKTFEILHLVLKQHAIRHHLSIRSCSLTASEDQRRAAETNKNSSYRTNEWCWHQYFFVMRQKRLIEYWKWIQKSWMPSLEKLGVLKRFTQKFTEQ